MRTIREWEARRSGGRITISGKDGAGAPVKIGGVDAIERSKATEGRTIATHSSGEQFELV